MVLRCLTWELLEVRTAVATITFTCRCCRRRSSMCRLAAFRSQSFFVARSQIPDGNGGDRNTSCRSDGKVPHRGPDGSRFSIRTLVLHGSEPGNATRFRRFATGLMKRHAKETTN